MTTLYSATAVAKQLHVNPARLIRWLNNGLFKGEYQAMLGDTPARLFTEKEIQRLRAVVDLIDSGTPVQEAFGRLQGRPKEREQ
jgi:DNA-binding transcriptional MerR regulator